MQSLVSQLQAVRLGAPAQALSSRAAVGSFAVPGKRQAPAAIQFAVQAMAGEVKYSAVGRRKTAVAKVYIVPGTGNVTFNGKPAAEYLGYNPAYVGSVRDPLEILGLEGSYDVIVKAHGGGVMGQAEAARLGISRALCDIDAGNRSPLKAEGFLKRDPRAVERKKYGLRKARKRPQYSKR